MTVHEAIDARELTEAVTNFGVKKEIAVQVAQTAQKLLALFLEKDLTTAEINPLAELMGNTLIAADAKVVIDDNALYRQNIPLLLPRGEDKSPAALAAEEAGLAYVRLDKDGDIGIIAGGAGIGMNTVDTVYYYGGKPFNFMDLGGGVTREKTCSALSLLLADKRVKGVICNVFGGINNCLTMAEGFRDAIHSVQSDAVVVVKSRGFSQEEGWRIYDELGLGQVRYGTTDDAVKRLMAQMQKREENK
jgi:succinyl-CoA synthetase beta subunit